MANIETGRFARGGTWLLFKPAAIGMKWIPSDFLSVHLKLREPFFVGREKFFAQMPDFGEG